MSQATTAQVLEIIGLILAILIIVLILIPASKPFLSNLFSSNSICEDGGSRTWEKLKEIFKELDKENSKEYEVALIKGKCDLVTFSLGSISDFKISKTYYSELPQICLCQINDKVCDPYDCYRFENIKEINKFSTLELPEHTFLNFKTRANILYVSHS